jgi:hypothetical protein
MGMQLDKRSAVGALLYPRVGADVPPQLGCKTILATRHAMELVERNLAEAPDDTMGEWHHPASRLNLNGIVDCRADRPRRSSSWHLRAGLRVERRIAFASNRRMTAQCDGISLSTR